MSSEKVDPELLAEKDAIVGEGAIWDAEQQVLYWVDILSHEVYVYDPASGVNRAIPTCQAVGTVVKRKSGGLVVALHNGFAHLDLESEKIAPLGDDPERTIPANRFNDGKCDPAGRLWAGTMEFAGAKDQGALYCLDTDHSVCEKVAPVSVSNGIVWTADQQTMYFIDSGLNNVRAYDYDIESGAISNERVVAENEGAGVYDGMAIDEEDTLWIAVYGGSCVKRYDPQDGALLRELQLPMTNVTSCAFGGENLDQLYITSACQGLDAEAMQAQPLAGSLVRVDPGVRGVPSDVYAG
jgi:sugar lactone lactonase YvrE